MSLFQYQALAEPLITQPATPVPELSFFQPTSQPVLPQVRARLGFFVQPLEIGGYMPMVMPPVGENPMRRRRPVAATEIVEPLAEFAMTMPMAFLFAETSQPIVIRRGVTPEARFTVTAPVAAANNAAVLYISLMPELMGGHQ